MKETDVIEIDLTLDEQPVEETNKPQPRTILDALKGMVNNERFNTPISDEILLSEGWKKMEIGHQCVSGEVCFDAKYKRFERLFLLPGPNHRYAVWSHPEVNPGAFGLSKPSETSPTTSIKEAVEKGDGVALSNINEQMLKAQGWRVREIGEVVTKGDIENHGKVGGGYRLSSAWIGHKLEAHKVPVWTLHGIPKPTAKTYLLKAECITGDCSARGYVVRVTNKWANKHGLPVCPACSKPFALIQKGE